MIMLNRVNGRYITIILGLLCFSLYTLENAYAGSKPHQQQKLRPFHARWVSGNVYIEQFDAHGNVKTKKPISHKKDIRVYPGDILVTGTKGTAKLNLNGVPVDIDPKMTCKIEASQVTITMETAGAERKENWRFLSPASHANIRAKDFTLKWKGQNNQGIPIKITLFVEGKDDPIFEKDGVDVQNNSIDPSEIRKALSGYKGKKPANVLIVIADIKEIYHITWFKLVR